MKNVILIGVMCLLFAVLGAYLMRCRIQKNKPQQIGTIVVDHSDGAANIFLEIASDDVEKWEHNKEYSVNVEIRDYLPQE